MNTGVLALPEEDTVIFDEHAGPSHGSFWAISKSWHQLRQINCSKLFRLQTIEALVRHTLDHDRKVPRHFKIASLRRLNHVDLIKCLFILLFVDVVHHEFLVEFHSVCVNDAVFNLSMGLQKL